jgi:carbon monoxide dehydrogenase subunit G
MSTKVTAAMTYEATPAEVWAMFRDPDYVAEKIKHTGGTNPQVSVTETGSDVEVWAIRDLPAQVPGFVKTFTGDVIHVVEHARWSPADEFGSRSAVATLEFQGTPSTINGRLDLHPSGTGTVVDVEFTVKASVPLIGGKIEGVIGNQIERAVRQENKVGVAWLTGGEMP